MNRSEITKMLESTPAEALLITHPANMRYVAGFTGEGYVYVSPRRCMVVTDSRYTIAAALECPQFDVVEWGKKEYYEELAAVLLEEEISTLGYEEAHMTVAEFHKLEAYFRDNGLSGIQMKGMGDCPGSFRRIKGETEIQHIARAEEIGDRAFMRILPELKAGMTEKQVAARLEFYMKEEGAEGLSFDTIAASGIHSAMPHAVPTDKRLEEGDFLTMDFGCIWKGYCSDMTRTVVIGRASEKQREVYGTVLKAQMAALHGIRPGMTGRDVDSLAREVISRAGYGEYFGHSLGHSVGLEIHEKPLFSPKEQTIIRPGMVITVEPGIYIEGFGGVRIEDVAVITEDGCEDITHAPKELMEL